ncbi:MAG: ROK family protein [Candidatus Omnitrophota bacterium]
MSSAHKVGTENEASLLDLPDIGSMVNVSQAHNPAQIIGIKIYSENPSRFDFLLSSGDSELKGQAYQDEALKLIKYFLASLTTKEEDLWVNLSPYEGDRIIPEKFGQTEMGRDLLSEDYILKQLTASLIFPENDLGEQFWQRVYDQAHKRFGTTEIPLNTFSKVWIVPERATVYQTGEYAFVVESHLKVMLEEDYKAPAVLAKNNQNPADLSETNKASAIPTQVLREIIIPEIEKEVNSGKNFARLRQIQNALILATWYKNTLKEKLLGRNYVNKDKIVGIDLEEKDISQKIYNRYLEAFKHGVYDFIREDYDAQTGQLIPRKYFSGGYTTSLAGTTLAERIDIIPGQGGPAKSFEEALRAGGSPVRPPTDPREISVRLQNIRKFTRLQKVHVIGATSFLGRKLYESLKSSYAEVVGTGFEKAEEMGLVKLDVTNEEDVSRYFETVSDNDIVIYAAGWTDVDSAAQERGRARALNVEAVNYIAKCFQGKFVYISSDNVFDGRSTDPYKVSDQANPVNYYGKTKLEGEQATLSNFTKIPPMVLRLGELYGYNGETGKETFAAKVISALEEGRVVVADRYSWKGPILIDDVASGVATLLGNNSSGIHQLNGPQRLTKFLWAQKIAKVWSEVTGKESPKIQGEKAQYQEPRPQDSYMQSDLKSSAVERGTYLLLKQMGIVKDNRIPEDLYSIGISLGGTKIGAALISGAGYIVNRAEELQWRQKYGDAATSEQVIDGIMAKIEEVLEGIDDIGRVVKIGVAFAGPVDSGKGIVGTPFASLNLPFDNYPFAEEIKKRFKALIKEKFSDGEQIFFEVSVYNDCAAAVLGEFNRSGSNRGKHGMAFILGTGTNGAVIMNGELYTDHNALLELGFNLIRKGETGEWIYTGRSIKGGKPKKDSGDVYNIELFAGDKIAKSFLQNERNREVAALFIKYGDGDAFKNADEICEIVMHEQKDDQGKKLQALAIRLLLEGITRAVNAGNSDAVEFVKSLGYEFGRSMGALVQDYIFDLWVEHIVLVSSLGEKFAKIEGREGEDDVFVGAIRQGLRDSLEKLKGKEGFEELDDARIALISGGIERSKMDWEREVLAAKLTTKDIHSTSIIPKEIRDRYKILKKLVGGGSSAGTYLVRDKDGREIILKFATWAGIGSNGIPWLQSQVKRLRELKENLPPLGASKIPEVYDYEEKEGLVYYTLEYLKDGRPLSLYHLEHPEGGPEAFLEDLENMLDLMAEQFYSQGRLDLPEDYIKRVHVSRLNYRMGLLKRQEGEVYERLIKNRPFKFGNGRHRDIASLFNEIWNRSTISINGHAYANAPNLVYALEANPVFMEGITPSFLPRYAHGDALLRNFMRMKDGSIKVFDVRGVDLPDNSPARVDITYELGKFLHGILLEIVRNDLFDMEIRRGSGGELEFELHYDMDNPSVKNFLEVRRKMPELFKNHPGLNKILKDEPRWLVKALFAEASHFLADAINRLENDLSGRHTIAYYLIGTMLLNDYFGEVSETDLFREAGNADQASAAEKEAASDETAGLTPGGIDLNPNRIALRINRDQDGIPLIIQDESMRSINVDFDGLVPIIMDIRPINLYEIGDVEANDALEYLSSLN